ncbi:hypothetical protein PoB_006194800 [Plakobranchus ocellatus]|uniref:Uncharacterized protein n=1 Tax=Plakobranchus ocellatus TaxID=259542 RepID=A0AAV4CU40_9GAST|nr:hypothetical protein PoB_006194800 [Plakobranchus ocellatus]
MHPETLEVLSEGSVNMVVLSGAACYLCKVPRYRGGAVKRRAGEKSFFFYCCSCPLSLAPLDFRRSGTPVCWVLMNQEPVTKLTMLGNMASDLDTLLTDLHGKKTTGHSHQAAYSNRDSKGEQDLPTFSTPGTLHSADTLGKDSFLSSAGNTSRRHGDVLPFEHGAKFRGRTPSPTSLLAYFSTCCTNISRGPCLYNSEKIPRWRITTCNKDLRIFNILYIIVENDIQVAPCGAPSGEHVPCCRIHVRCVNCQPQISEDFGASDDHCLVVQSREDHQCAVIRTGLPIPWGACSNPKTIFVGLCDVGGTVDSEPALRSARILLSQVPAWPPALWPVEGQKA